MKNRKLNIRDLVESVISLLLCMFSVYILGELFYYMYKHIGIDYGSGIFYKLIFSILLGLFMILLFLIISVTIVNYYYTLFAEIPIYIFTSDKYFKDKNNKGKQQCH